MRPPASAQPPSFAALLARGQVALMRSEAGTLGDVSVLDARLRRRAAPR
jgi:hypothetical protein